MKKDLFCKRYELLCQVLDSSPKGLEYGKGDLFIVHSNLLIHKGYFTSKKVTRVFLERLIVSQAAGEMVGPWLVTSEKVFFRLQRQVLIYTFARVEG